MFKKKTKTTTVTTVVTKKRKYQPDYPTLANMDDETKAAGKTDFIKYLNGEHLNLRESISAKCYECMGYYADGIADCEQQNCCLYPFHPYNPNPAKLRKERPEMRKKK